jgi:5-methylcytosine-specific restriction endonuclease McrA
MATSESVRRTLWRGSAEWNEWEARLRAEGLAVIRPDNPAHTAGTYDRREDNFARDADRFEEFCDIQDVVDEGAGMGPTLERDHYEQTIRCGAPGFERPLPRGACAQRFDVMHDQRAQRYGVVSTLTEVEWYALIDASDGRCAYCGGTTATPSPDHVRPMCNGGANTVWNLACACLPCNLSKGAKSLDRWLTAPGAKAALARIKASHERLAEKLGVGLPTEAL